MGLEDFGNDGWKDLFVAQGHVLDNVEQIDPSLHYWELPLFAMNHEGRFERADSGSAAPAAGRGAAFGDLNNDGWQDAVMTTLGGAPQVFFNRGGKAHWLVISLRGTRSNRDGFGARVQDDGRLDSPHQPEAIFHRATSACISDWAQRLRKLKSPGLPGLARR